MEENMVMEPETEVIDIVGEATTSVETTEPTNVDVSVVINDNHAKYLCEGAGLAVAVVGAGYGIYRFAKYVGNKIKERKAKKIIDITPDQTQEPQETEAN